METGNAMELKDYVIQSLNVWKGGGWTMIPLLIVAMGIYVSAMSLVVWFRRREYRNVTEKEWRSWVDHPSQGRGEVGEIIRYTSDEVHSPVEVQDRFSEIGFSKFPKIEQRLNLITVLVNSAPLMGLLGTVLGMLATFQALAQGGGAQTMDKISSGISEALITTEMGLLVAIPGYVLVAVIKRRKEEYEAFLAAVETACVQACKRRMLKIRGHEKVLDSPDRTEPSGELALSPA
ncbi:MAG: MotA/TolQ/ExbB proton channel family protein [Verrucomicrobiae bacterium]|jgi:biopolymer transport protein ExbB|nr:MotA/TolQ/ExbB proton channel family protein [Verrucomicrobiae bacterium]